MEALLVCPADDGGGWCRKHPSSQPPTGGVCPVCLRTRLLRLCPDCAAEKPCGCTCPSTSSTASSSSLSSISSLDLTRSGASGAYVGAVGRVSHLIDSEPAFRRSRSAAFRLVRPRSQDAAGSHVNEPPHLEGGGKGWSWLWPFTKAKKAEEEGAKDAVVTTFPRSRSVGLGPGAYPAPFGTHGIGYGSGVCGEDNKGKGWNRYFPSPMKAFRHRKPSKVGQARFPLCRDEEVASYMAR